MATEAEIKATHKEIHDSLEENYYIKHLMSKEDFDYLHGQNWADMEAELIAGGYLKPPESVRDLEAEIDEITAKLADYDSLKAKVAALETKVTPE